MKILIIHSSLSIGGIETFIVRISSELKRYNVQVNVLFFSEKVDVELMKKLKANANVFFWDDYTVIPIITRKLSPFLKFLFPLKIKRLRNDLADITHIHAPDILSILFAQRLKKIFLNIPLSTGVYHINEFKIHNLKKWLFARYIYNLFYNLPANNVIFFNEISVLKYSELFSKKFDDKLVSPIGVDLDKFRKTKDFIGLKTNRIVSIGRLASWKTYNFHMIAVIYELKQKGYSLFYESYGDGEMRGKLEELVKQLDLSQNVFFHNSIGYEKFDEAINDSIMFIGAGTALIEAAACGIPALIGIENEAEPLTYGFLHETTSYSYQEKDLIFKKYNIVDYIEKLLLTSDDEYRKLCNLSRKRAFDFDLRITGQKFHFLISHSKNFEYKLNYLDLVFFTLSLSLHKVMSVLFKLKDSYFRRF